MNISPILYSHYNNFKFEKSEKLKNPDSSNCVACYAPKTCYYPKNYYISFKGDNFKQQLEKQLQNSSEDEIYLFIYNQLKKRAEELRMSRQIVDDVIQDAILNIFILMADPGLSKDELISEINDIYIRLKPNRNNYVKRFAEASLDKPIVDDKKRKLLDIIPDDENHRIQYLHPPDEKQKEKTKQELDMAISKSELTNKQKLILQEEYSEDGINSMASIARKYGVSGYYISRIIKQAVLKTQIANNSLSKDTEQKIEAFANTFNYDKKTAQNIVVKYPFLLSFEINNLKNNVYSLIKKFEDKGLTAENYIMVLAKQPQLFIQLPETIEKNIMGVVNEFKDNGLTTNKYLKAAVKQPNLFYRSPDSVEKNIKGLVKKFQNDGLTTEKYLEAAVKIPSLFASNPDTIEKNVKGLVEKFQNDGLTTEKYLEAAVKCPSLFASNPDTIEKNVLGVVDKFKENGLTTSKYLKATAKCPTLFSISPDTVEKNIKGLVEKFKDSGITSENYLQAALKQPELFYRKPETVEKNIKDLAEKFKEKGLCLNKYIQAAIKMPPIFTMSADTIAEHLDILRFGDFNKGKIIDNEEFYNKILNNPTKLCWSSQALMIKEIIIPKMFENDIIPKSLRKRHLKENLNEYLKENPDKTYNINVRDISSNTNCIDLLKQTLTKVSIEALGRDDIFKINATDNN